MAMSRTGDGKFLVGSARYNSITLVIAQQLDTTHSWCGATPSCWDADIHFITILLAGTPRITYATTGRVETYLVYHLINRVNLHATIMECHIATDTPDCVLVAVIIISELYVYMDSITRIFIWRPLINNGK